VTEKSSTELLFVYLIPNGVQDCIDIVHNIAIPEPQNAVSLRFQVLSSFQVILSLIQMLATI